MRNILFVVLVILSKDCLFFWLRIINQFKTYWSRLHFLNCLVDIHIIMLFTLAKDVFIQRNLIVRTVYCIVGKYDLVCLSRFYALYTFDWDALRYLALFLCLIIFISYGNRCCFKVLNLLLQAEANKRCFVLRIHFESLFTAADREWQQTKRLKLFFYGGLHET